MRKNFNSIKVQLERHTSYMPADRNPFQFHKGTIRTNTQQGQVHQLGYFNSIKVQLEPKGSVAFNEYKEFQFHKGTIRTGRVLKENRIDRISIP